MKFYDVLASIIHDMKNSLGMVINTLEEVTDGTGFQINDRDRIIALQHEAKRLNNNLIELLTLYKIENERVSPNIEELNVYDFLEDIVAENSAIATAKGIDISFRCDPDLNGFFDEGMIRGVINNLIGNGMRYTRDHLLVTAEELDGFLVISVDDNGKGFPEDMLQAQQVQQADEQVNAFIEGRTQLGIYFSSMVAKMHRNKGDEGFIRLSNNQNLEGGCFSILLP